MCSASTDSCLDLQLPQHETGCRHWSSRHILSASLQSMNTAVFFQLIKMCRSCSCCQGVATRKAVLLTELSCFQEGLSVQKHCSYIVPSLTLKLFCCKLSYNRLTPILKCILLFMPPSPLFTTGSEILQINHRDIQKLGIALLTISSLSKYHHSAN